MLINSLQVQILELFFVWVKEADTITVNPIFGYPIKAGDSARPPEEGIEEILVSDDDDNQSQGMASILDISISDPEDIHKCAACEAARKSDTLFAEWRAEQIWQGNEAVAKLDRSVYIRKPCRNPDPIGPPLLYMESHGCFQVVHMTSNPLELCRFYRVNTDSSSLPVPKHPATVDILKNLLSKVKNLGQDYIIVVFEGGNITPLGLLLDLHSRFSLSRISIATCGEEEPKPCVSCCPLCMYVVKNDPSFLNHIVIGHYWCNYACGRCLDFVAMSAQQLKRHIPLCKGIVVKSDPPKGEAPRSPSKGTRTKTSTAKVQALCPSQRRAAAATR